MPENKRESPPIITAVAVNRAGTIAVRATEHAVPVDLRIQPGRTAVRRAAVGATDTHAVFESSNRSRRPPSCGARGDRSPGSDPRSARSTDPRRTGRCRRRRGPEPSVELDAFDMSEIDRIMELAKHRTGLLQDAVDGVGALRVVVSSEGGDSHGDCRRAGRSGRPTDHRRNHRDEFSDGGRIDGGHDSPGSSTVQRRTATRDLVSELRVALKQT